MMRRFLPFLALLAFAPACEQPAATETIELTIRGIGPQDQDGDRINAEIALVGGQCDIGPCLPNPCPNLEEGEDDIPAQTRCIGMGSQFQCFCPAGQHLETNDETMESSCVPDTQCEDGTCNGHGICSEMEGQLTCECDEGYLGANCETCDEENGFYDNGFGGCEQDVPVCRIGGADEFEAFLANAEAELGRPPVELAVTRLDVDIDESSALVVRAWPAIFEDEAFAYFRTYDGFPDEAARYDIWTQDENGSFVEGSDTMPTIEGEVLIGRQVLKSDPDYLAGEFAIGLEGTTPLQVTQPYGFDAIITLEIEAY
jgi:hypothetical protein